MANITPSQPKPSFLYSLLSLLLPGLGQFVAGFRSRGITILFTYATLFGLSAWTIAQRARFPDVVLGANMFARLTIACALLLIFLLALRRLLTRFVLRDPVVEGFSGLGVALLFFLALILGGGRILQTVASPAQLSQIHGMTAILAAGAMAGLWLWQVVDATHLSAYGRVAALPSMFMVVLLACLLIFTLGYTITGVDVAKAVTEYQDLSRILPSILWPWETAFAYDSEVVEETQRIQAPCPEGASGPPSNPPEEDDPWISATPTCGDLGTRTITGGFTPGTELTITGGNFTPGETVDIRWKNPIGQRFEPRGVGPTEIQIDENGKFTTLLNIPDVVVGEGTSVGDQIHTLVVLEESEKVFGGRLSSTMELALKEMVVTIMIGLMATFFGILLAFPLSFLAAKNLMASIVTPMEQVVGSLAGLVAGAWATFSITGFVAESLGGLAAAPIPIFILAIVLLIGLGMLGLRLGGWLSAAILRAAGGVISYWVAAALLAVMAAVPGFVLGLAFSRGIRALVVGAEVAAATENLYGYIGALICVVGILIYAMLNRTSRGISVGLIVYTVTRTVLNIVRSIEPLIMAVVFGIWVGLGPFAGTIALTLHTIASLAKLYSEAIESIDPGPLEAIEATGATRLQTIVYAVVPQILPPYISFTIYRWDINIRMSTIIGLVGGGGIGFLLIQWIRLYDYEAAGIAIWLITITVATLDYVSSAIRERFV
ncbi:MAG: ABC transporter permease subunit [Anaerolineales bacterium]